MLDLSLYFVYNLYLGSPATQKCCKNQTELAGFISMGLFYYFLMQHFIVSICIFINIGALFNI